MTKIPAYRHAEYAIRREKDARNYRANGETISAAEKFEEAGDHRIQNAKYLKETGQPYRTELLNAMGDYKQAKNGFVATRLQERADSKITSIKRTLSQSIKKRKIKRPLEQLADDSLILPVLSIGAFFFALIFSSFGITGQVISDTTNSTANYISLGAFLLGIILASFYLRKIIKEKAKRKAMRRAKRKATLKRKKVKKKK